MVGPAAIRVLGHDDALEVPRPQRRTRHGIGQRLSASLVPDPGERQVVPVAATEHKRPFLESFGQPFHQPRRVGQLFHVRLQPRPAQAHAAPVDVGCRLLPFPRKGGAPLPYGETVNQHARVDAHDALDGFRLTGERPLGAIGDGHAHGKALHAPRCIGEVEIVASVTTDAVGCPHGVTRRVAPRHLLLGQYDAVVGPVRQVRRREHVVVLHREPVLPLPRRRLDVVGGVDVHLIIKYACGGVGHVLPTDDGVLGLRSQSCPEGHRP